MTHRAIATAIQAIAAFATTACFATNPAYPDEESSGQGGSESTSTPSDIGTGSTTVLGSSETTNAEHSSSGQADCAVLECPLIPEGWDGPLRERDTPGANTLDLFESANAQPYDCECHCGPTDSASCPTLQVQIFNGDNCQVATGVGETDFTQPQDDAESCTDIGAQRSVRILYASAEKCMGGDCPSCESIPSRRTSAPDLSGERYFLEIATTRCEADLGCFETGDDPVCLAKPGAHLCPDGFDDSAALFSEVADTRDCTECTCADPTGVQCRTVLGSYSDSTCDSNADEFAYLTTGGQCLGVPEGGAFSTSTEVENPGSCAPLGGQPTGLADAAAPYTVCCTSP